MNNRCDRARHFSETECFMVHSVCALTNKQARFRLISLLTPARPARLRTYSRAELLHDGDARWDAPPGRRRRGESKGESLLACRGAGSKISERHVKVQAMLRFVVL